jgi:hypothetical protein
MCYLSIYTILWSAQLRSRVVYAAGWSTELGGLHRWMILRLFRLGWMRTAFSVRWMRKTFSTGLNGDGFFNWSECGRLFHMGWMGTTFSYGLDGNGFFIWVGWERLYHMDWTGRLFHMNWTRRLFIWVELGRLFLMGWMRTAFSINVWFCPRFRADRVVRALPVYHMEDPIVGWVAELLIHIDRFRSSVISTVH